jgi:hypothetical protein
MDNIATNDNKNPTPGNMGGDINDKNATTVLSTSAASAISGSDFVPRPFLSASKDPSFADWFARPFLIASAVATGTLTPVTDTFLDTYLQHAITHEKTRFFHALTGTVKYRLIITTSPYAAGLVGMASHLYPLGASGPVDLANIGYHICSRTHVLTDVGCLTTTELSVPIRGRYPYVELKPTDPVSTNMYLTLGNITPVVDVSTGADAEFSYKLYISIDDAQLLVPTPMEPTAELREAAAGPISYPASIISRLTNSLRDVPIIGPYAYATSLISGAIGHAAVLFGFSRPKDGSEIPYPHDELLADYAGSLRVKSLTLDPMAEIPVDPSFLGEFGDNLTYKNIIGREGLLYVLYWQTTRDVGYELGSFPVVPTFCFAAADLLFPTPLAYGSLSHKLWRGTLIYRFLFPANRFVRGKVRFWWSPTDGTPVTDAIYQSALSVVLDLSMSTEIELEVPWGGVAPYRTVPYCGLNGHGDFSNGVLKVWVEDPLIAPSSAYEQTIAVFVRAGDDFQLQIPDAEKILNTHRVAADGVKTPWIFTQATAAPLPLQALTPADTNDDYFEYTMESSPNNPTHKVRYRFLPTAPTVEAKLNMGEQFNSFRPMLKRFYMYGTVPPLSTGGVVVKIFFSYLPSETKWCAMTGGTYLLPTFNNPVRFFSNLFAGIRGSIRYRHSWTANPARMLTYRDFGRQATVTKAPATTLGALTAGWFAPSTGTGSASFWTAGGESGIVEIPHQFVSNFHPTGVSANWDYEYGYSILSQSTTEKFDVWVSTGEDFMPVIWNGVPLIYHYPTPLVAPG